MRYLKYIIAFVVLVAIFHFAVNRSIGSDVPPFISAKLDELLSNEVLIDSIGGAPHYEFSFNGHDYKLKDTVRYTIKLKGREKTLVYEGVQVKTSSEKWSLLTGKINIE